MSEPIDLDELLASLRRSSKLCSYNACHSSESIEAIDQLRERVAELEVQFETYRTGAVSLAKSLAIETAQELEAKSAQVVAWKAAAEAFEEIPPEPNEHLSGPDPFGSDHYYEAAERAEKLLGAARALEAEGTGAWDGYATSDELRNDLRAQAEAEESGETKGES